MKIHVISTINGQLDEGMRNIATHLTRAMEAEHTLVYSSLKNAVSILYHGLFSDVSVIFARANKWIYWLARILALFQRNLWIVCTQKPDSEFHSLAARMPLKANYLYLVAEDVSGIVLGKNCRKEHFSVGLDVRKFKPVDPEQQKRLKKKYGFSEEKKLVLHVGHCSSGRGLESFSHIENAEKLVVASGMFESNDVIRMLEANDVRIISGYQEHIEEYYQLADVYLFPTCSAEHVISIPLSVVEALACGVPVVGYRKFANLREISCRQDAIVLVDNAHELNESVVAASAQKCSCSMLETPRTWEQVAKSILEIIRERNI